MALGVSSELIIGKTVSEYNIITPAGRRRLGRNSGGLLHDPASSIFNFILLTGTPLPAATMAEAIKV